MICWTIRADLSPVESCEDVGRFGADSEVGVAFSEDDGVGLVDDEDGRDREAPAGFSGVVIAEAGVIEGDIDEDGLVVAAEGLGDGVGYPEFVCDRGAGVGEERVMQAMLLEGEVVLASRLRGDRDEDGAASAEVGVKVAPGFEFGDAVGIPAATKEVDNQRAEGEQIG
jgi:hypothetical protein